MLGKFGLAAAALLMSAVPALAVDCSGMPVPPALIAPGDLAQKSPADALKAKHDAFLDVKNWQGSLKDYRACLDSTVTADKRTISMADPTKDKDKIAAAKSDEDDANKQYDNSVNTEEKLVNDFHAIQAAFCTRADVDRTSCPK